MRNLWAVLLFAACTTNGDDEPLDTGSPLDSDGRPAATGEHEVTLRFRAVVDDEPFSCNREYRYLGASGGASLRFNDLRLFLQDVGFIDRDEHVPLTLDEGPFQSDAVALLDFEDASGTCREGTPEINTTITGRIPNNISLRELQFTIGVPFDLNHTEPEEDAAPLNAPGMFRDSFTGHYFFRLDSTVLLDNQPWPVHIQSARCRLQGGQVSECLAPNRAAFTFDGFDPDADEIVIDLRAMLARVDPNLGTGGCRSEPTDPDCAEMFIVWGLGAAEQSFIRVERPESDD